MSSSFSHLRAPHFPSSLRAQLAHGNRFARAVRALQEDVAPDDAAALWLTGRSEEIDTFVDDVARAWMVGTVSEERASGMIEEYLASLHAALEPWYGRWYAPSCCGPQADARGSGIRLRPVPAASGDHGDRDTIADLSDACDAPDSYRTYAPTSQVRHVSLEITAERQALTA